MGTPIRYMNEAVTSADQGILWPRAPRICDWQIYGIGKARLVIPSASVSVALTF